MAKVLTTEQIAQFHDHGWLSPFSVFSGEQIGFYQRKLIEWETRNGGPIGGQLRNKSHLFLTWLDALVRHPAVLDVIEDVIGPNIWLWHAQFFIKESNTGHFVSFHQDSAYWDIDPSLGVSAWIAFSDSDESSGCMRVIPNTHLGVLPHEERKGPRNLLWRGQTASLGDVRGEAVDMPLKTGQMSLHHARIVHGSGPNRAGYRRIGYSVRYFPTHIKRLGPRDSALLVRGVDEFGTFAPEPAPVRDFDPEAIAFHARATERYMAQYTSAPVEFNRMSG